MGGRGERVSLKACVGRPFLSNEVHLLAGGSWEPHDDRAAGGRGSLKRREEGARPGLSHSY